jgi:4-amino-4-deoxy-L-arabinose transferase-like glycosyltransferase
VAKAKKRQSAGNTVQARTEATDVRWDYACLLLILLAASILILSNLGNQCLWGDEAATALVSRTILTHGIPMGTDGMNYFSQLSGAECTKNLVWVWHPWFPFYLLAGFFALFGVSTFTARLPFALMGIATILVAYLFGKSLWRSRQAGIYSAVLMMISVPFLILVRQSRYYSPEILLSLLGLYGYHMLLERRKHGAVLMGISAALLFNTHYVQCAVLLGTVIIHSFVFHRDRLKLVLIVSAAVAAVSLPWIIAFSGIGQVIAGYGDLVSRSLSAMRVYCTDIAEYVFHPSLLLIPVFMAAAYYQRNRRLPAYNSKTGERVWLLMIFSVLTLVAAAITGQGSFFRYIGPVIPAACLIAALIIFSTDRLHVIAGIIIMAGIAYWTRMPDYVYEITHDYNGPVRAISAYLNEHGKSSDVVAVNHEDLPIKFYTKMRVVSGVTGEDWSLSRNADWIVLRRNASSVERRFTHYLIQDIRRGNYRPVILDCSDIPFENREEPALHCFRTVTDAPQVIVMRRVAISR